MANSWGNSDRLYLFIWAPKSLQMVTAATKLRCLLFGKKKKTTTKNKTMTKLNSILKSRDVTLPTKVHLVKVMVIPVAMYGCESWTIKKAECQRILFSNCGTGEDS